VATAWQERLQLKEEEVEEKEEEDEARLSC
jgi:hypothetical protein